LTALGRRIGPLAGDRLSAFYREELVAHALAAAFFGLANPAEMARSGQLLETAYQLFPDLDRHGNLSLMRVLNLATIAGNRSEFGPHLERFGRRFLRRHPDHPVALYYLGSYLAHVGDTESAAALYRRIVDAANYERNWYTGIAAEYLARYDQD
jgi:hypothetical protein